MRLVQTRVLASVAVITVLLAGCAGGTKKPFAKEQRLKTDSIANTKHTIEELVAWEQECQQEDDRLGRLTCLRVLGQAYRNESRFDDAMRVHREGYELAEACGDTIEMERALNNLGTNYRRLGLLDFGADYHYRALSLFHASDDRSEMARKNRVYSLNGLGNIYLSVENYQLADSMLRLALAGERELNSPIGQAINYANLGSIFEKTGQLDSAEVYYQQAMKLNRDGGSDLGIALCHNYFGSLYERRHDYQKAMEEYQKAAEMMSRSKDVWHALEPTLSMVRINLRLDNSGEAMALLDDARVAADSINSLEHLSEIYHFYSQVYQERGDMRNAFDMYVRAEDIEDSIMDMKKMNELQNMQINLLNEYQQRRLHRVQGDFEHERATKWVIFIFLALLFCLLVFVVVQGLMILRRRSRVQEMEREVQRARDRFFTNITHEFRTPLTVINVANDELRKHIERLAPANAETMLKHVRNISSQGSNLLSLINQLLDMAKLSSAPETYSNRWRTGDIVAYASMIVDSFRSYADQKKQTLTFQANPKPLVMDFIPDLVDKILKNLIVNSIKFAYRESEIRVSIEQDGTEVRLSVKDRGIGMTPSQLAHVFDAFYQAPTESSHIGTGVGLSLVKLSVEAMNGTIQVNSRERRGTEFIITLHTKHGIEEWPLLTGNVPRTAIVPSRLLGTSENQPDDADNIGEDSPHVLIVEDSTELAHYMGVCLPKNYAVSYASDGRKGLEKARSIVPDLIITDVMMPEMDGFELCQKIREDTLLNHIPIIIVTAKTEAADRMQGLECGADAYLVKPFKADMLRLQVSKLLEQRQMLRRKFSNQLLTEAPTATATAVDAADTPSAISKAQMERGKEFLEKVNSQIARQMKDNQIDIGEIAASFFITRVQLNRKVKALTGMSTTNYVNHYRTETAKQLLAESPDLSIGDVGVAIGVLDVAYFSRKFKQLTGYTPSQYRKMSQKS